MKRILLLLTAILLAVSYAMAQDIIVKKDGTILKVYNLEESDISYFYTLESLEDAAIQKINKNDVFSVKKNGERKVISKIHPQRPTHDPVTAQISCEIINNKKGQFFSARTPDGHELNYQILSSEDHTLAVCPGKYRENKYIIPEYVQVNDQVYTVTEIGEKAFHKESKVLRVQIPTTLKIIRKNAFTYCPIQRISLPEGLQELADAAFENAGCNFQSGKSYTLKEIYIPSTIKKIGIDCFRKCGADTSPRGYCQAYFSNMPDFVTEGNCNTYGIDEKAVRAFNEKKKTNH